MYMRHLKICLICLILTTPAVSQTTAPSIAKRCEETESKWREKFAGEKLKSLIAPPFVIAGDGSIAQLKRYRDGTILAAARALRATYFKAEPDEPIVILLFESESPYRRLAKKWFGDDDVSPYGYFRHDNVMVMNVATGTGTLVHELVHALIKPDFPEVPSWFNEGLGSLYEQCQLNGDEIRGLENWRLPALQRAIRSDKLRPLREMIKDKNFYGDENVGMNYAQARYLLMYLQEKNLLATYYKNIKASHGEDENGLQTLEKLIEPKDLNTFEREWRAWVMTLKFG
jgi:hypothetical protein